MIKSTPELAKFVIINPYGKESIDFASPEAVRVFNRALLKAFYGIAHWDIPADYLCPPVPGRADYVHFLADLLASHNEGEIPRGAAVKVLDIGTGANCVYPLIGYSDYRWHFLGSEIDPTAIASAKAIVQSNGLNKAIQLRQQANRKQILQGLLDDTERFDLTMCNPPFHASLEEATKGSQRKWRALGKADPKRKLPVLNFGGQAAELWCEGGEARFVTQLIGESAQLAGQVLWFSTLVSKASNLPAIQTALKKRPGRCTARWWRCPRARSRVVSWPGPSRPRPSNRLGASRVGFARIRKTPTGGFQGNKKPCPDRSEARFFYCGLTC
nr:23S rRNA (adenine(1618)-N(6))-methyltransferase RlmF [Pseudomonas brassicacearum subsp. brassicacearum]